MSKEKTITTVQPYLDPSREYKRLNRILALQRDNDIIAMLLAGKTTKEIVGYISDKYRMQPDSVQKKYLTGCREIIKERKGYELNTMLSLHIARYEEIYEALYEMGANSIAMKALVAKERLFGFHKEGFHMKVTQGEISTISLQQIGSEYNVMKLDKDKRARLERLVNKMAESPAEKKKKSNKAYWKNYERKK